MKGLSDIGASLDELGYIDTKLVNNPLSGEFNCLADATTIDQFFADFSSNFLSEPLFTWAKNTKRKVGAYGMPLVANDRILGQADVKFDRENSTLFLKTLLPLSTVKFSLFMEKLEEAANKLADFLGADKVIMVADK